ATSCPPPRHNFTELPRIRSERPAFELHYPHMVERMHHEGEIGFFGKPKVHAGVKAPSQALTDAVIPGDHDKDNASEQ
ncbi:cytochrome ubiquinol oxidase subunit I, partial [Amycolatopsis tucumanensis]|nr:cytochrome ubiquinol oxidase subunit I [Amycolatopsis tucumanensis]